MPHFHIKGKNMFNNNSLKAYEKEKRNLAKRITSADDAIRNKNFWYQFYLDYFIMLITNYIEWENVPDGIDTTWIEKTICSKGYIGIFYDDSYGLLAQSGTMSEKLDYYDNPTILTPVNSSSTKFKKRQIMWYMDAATMEVENKLPRKKAVIIGNNNYYTPATTWLCGFAEKLANIEQAIQLNRNAQLMPYFILANQDNIRDMKSLFTKIISGEPVIFANTQKTKSGNIDPIQLNDLIQVFETKAPFIVDKLTDDRNGVINQVLTRIGIKTSPIDKAERVNDTEANSNNGLLASNLNIQLSARERGAALANTYFGTELKPKISERIERFNMKEVIKDIDNKVEEVEINADD